MAAAMEFCEIRGSLMPKEGFLGSRTTVLFYFSLAPVIKSAISLTDNSPFW